MIKNKIKNIYMKNISTFVTYLHCFNLILVTSKESRSSRIIGFIIAALFGILKKNKTGIPNKILKILIFILFGLLIKS